jgi:NAD(P)-dependent dehydrogenase (short-subunit alcohol dehydrogenase family)
LEAAAKEVQASGGRALAVPTDVADAAAVEDAAARIESELGPVDVWVNNAMASVFALFTEITPEEFRRVTDVTYHGYVNGTRAALQRMMPRNAGVIVQVGSALAYRGIPAQSAYCGAKHAIEGFTESIRCELRHSHSRVRIGMVQLPAVNTPQFDWVLSRLPRRAQPVPPIYQPELIARAVLHMADHPRREMWLTERTVLAIVGNRLFPGYLDRKLGREGVASQQTGEPADPGRPANLWQPLPGDRGAHGSFDSRSRDGSAAVWASIHRRPLTIAGLGSLGVAAGLVRGGGRTRRGRGWTPGEERPGPRR